MRCALRCLLAVAALSACACEREPNAPQAPEPEPAPREEPLEAEPEPEPVELTAPLVPRPGALHPETQARLVEGDPADAERLADVETCGGCHPDALAMWQSSAHSRASFDNPWYRQSVDAVRAERGREASRFCAGCHDPVLLFAGAMDDEISPDDPRAFAGVTCRVCHGIREVTADGAGSYTLSTREVPLPDPTVPREVEAHVAAVTPRPLRTAALCGSCHRGFLGAHSGNPHHLGGIDDLTPWRRSGYGGSPAARLDTPVEAGPCQGCHMPEATATEGDFAADREGHMSSHRFAGAHTALSSATGDSAQLAAQRSMLVGAASLDIAAVRAPSRRRVFTPADGAAIRAREALEVDVVVRNVGAGHRFPGGTLDAQDTWVEIQALDADGHPIATAGEGHARGDVDLSAHRLEAGLVDGGAHVERRHRVHTFEARVYDRTLGPRDASVVRYALLVPASAALPIHLRARLRHRRFPRELHDAACASQRSPRGAAFEARARALGRRPIDACAEQPITELAEASVWVGEGSEGRSGTGGASAPTWRRLFDYALALNADVSEHLDDARPALSAALEEAPDAHSRAMLQLQLGRLAGRQGRLEEALGALDEARTAIGPHPAIAHVRGDAYAQVWRWEEAADAYRLAALGAPDDDSRWVALARAEGSAGRDEAALEAALRGLALQPRSEALLRSQYLALEHLGRDGADEARAAYLAHRSPDAAPTLRIRCGERSEACATERLPVHVHTMR